MIPLTPILTMKKSTATITAKPKAPKVVVPAFDPKTAVERPHTQLFAHAATGRTVGFVQSAAKADEVHLFGVNRAFVATVPAATVPAIEVPPTNPPTVVAAVDGEVVQVPTTEAPPAS
jgi:hypothetical protein